MNAITSRKHVLAHLSALVSQAAIAWQLLRRHAWLAPILALGAWLRTTALHAEHLYGDQAEYALVARSLSESVWGLQYPPLSGGWSPFVSQPPLMLYLMALSMRVLGPTDTAAILPSVILGVLSIVVVYALAHRLGGRFAGVCAALLLAVMPFHVDMSRDAMLDVGYVFFVLLTALALVAWIQERTHWRALAAGTAAACAALSKLPGVLVVPVVAAVFLAAVAAAGWRTWREADARPALRETGVHAALAAAPIVLGGLLYLALLWNVHALEPLFDKLAWNIQRVSAGDDAKALDYYLTHPTQGLPALVGASVLWTAAAGVLVAFARFARRPTVNAAHIVVPLVALTYLAFLMGSARKVGFYLLPLAPLCALLAAGAAVAVRDLARTIRRDASAAATMIAALLVAGLPVHAAATEAYEEYRAYDGSSFGYGVREAAAWIHADDADAAQYGTLLGRFTLQWYNEHRTFHWFVDHDEIDQAARAGELRYVVFEQYLDLDHESRHMRSLIARYDGEEVARFERDGWAQVRLFRLDPAPPDPIHLGMGANRPA